MFRVHADVWRNNGAEWMGFGGRRTGHMIIGVWLRVDALGVDDDAVEAWFSANKTTCQELSEEALAEIALWFPVIRVPVNDNKIGALMVRS